MERLSSRIIKEIKKIWHCLLYTSELRNRSLSRNTAVMFDNFTSASFSMSFDDSSIGGSSYECCHVNCGPAGMTFRNIENALGKILDECRETGECLQNEETEIGNGFQGMFALHGISPQSPKETWTCQSCGTEGNISKFCPNCGKPRLI